MATSVVMPALEMAQETGKIVSWLKKEGDVINKGEPLLEVETDKAVVEVEACADGVLAGVKSHEGDVVPVGVTIAWIVAAGEQPAAESATAAPAARKTTEQPAAAVADSAGGCSQAATIHAIVTPTGTTSPSCDLTPASTPSADASTSTTALSVSTSSSGSPLLMTSPSFFNHETIFPVSCAISSAGITTLVAITFASC